MLGVQGKQIKIGLEVPNDMQVYREEVYLRVLEQNRQAMQASDQDVLAAADNMAQENEKVIQSRWGRSPCPWSG